MQNYILQIMIIFDGAAGRGGLLACCDLAELVEYVWNWAQREPFTSLLMNNRSFDLKITGSNPVLVWN